MNEFGRLSAHIKEFIYSRGWTELREIQGKAIHAILDDSRHVLISSGTASGKTEAAFFPILSQLEREKCSSVAVLYIGPLKALINDQFERLNALLDQTYVPVWRWHGDVPAADKKKLLDAPSGILQITPESLEALMLRHTGDIIRLFCDLRYIVIDEVHAFMGADRGGQLLCQIAKIERWAKCSPRRIGLSATLGDYSQAAAWLGSGSDYSTAVLEDGKVKRKLLLAADWFEKEEPKEQQGEKRPSGEMLYYHTLYEQCHHSKSIIFTNSRSEAENTIAHMREIAREKHEPDIFHVHHGSISKVLRQDAEQAMKQQEGPTVTAATLTLELGIDIGKLERVIQVGAPYSCSSFVQRLGRSGRRDGEASELYFTYLDEPGKTDDLLGAMPWTLLQMIAIIQLYVEQRWIEPIDAKPLPFSLLYHQTMSILASMGERTPSQLARDVLTLPAFQNVTQDDYRALLNHLLAIDHLQTTDEGTLIIGLAAEPIINHFTFYAVFPDDEEYKVSCDGKELGSVNTIPPEQSCIALAGRFWQVLDVDLKQKHILVKPAKRSTAALWSGGAGDIHTKIVQRMRRVLQEDTAYPYLFSRASERLDSARILARKSGLDNQTIISLSESTLLFIPWCGSREMRTWAEVLRKKDIRDALSITSIEQKMNMGFHIRTGFSPEIFQAQLRRMVKTISSLDDAIDARRIPYKDKFDYILPDELLKRQYICNDLDLESVKQW